MTEKLARLLSAGVSPADIEEDEEPSEEAAPLAGHTPSEARRDGPPSPNGTNGTSEPVEDDETLDWSEEAPIRNGSNGTLAALARLVRMIRPLEQAGPA